MSPYIQLNKASVYSFTRDVTQFMFSPSSSPVVSFISFMPTCSTLLAPSATANNEDTIILSPPTTLTVQEGEAVTVPCVASGTQQPVFMFGGSVLPTGAQSNQYSLDFAAIASESNGSYSCQVGSTTSTFSINVLRRLHHSLSLLSLQEWVY